MTLEKLQEIRYAATGEAYQSAQNVIDDFFLKDKSRKSKRELRKLKKTKRNIRGM